MTDPNNQPLWNDAINLVIGGCGLLSKRPTRYNSSNWPSYYKSAKGIKIKSLQDKWYKDYKDDVAFLKHQKEQYDLKADILEEEIKKMART